MGDTPTILVIDDQAAVCRSIEKVLRRDGYQVESCLGGLEGLERARERRVDLVISDLMMPQMTGTNLLQRMKAAGMSLPVIIITAYAGVDSCLESFGLGAMDYLPKPFTVNELRASVRRALRGGQIDPATLPSPPCGTFVIRRHSWARRGGDATVLVGAHPFLLQCCGAVRAVDLANEADELVQGRCFGRLSVEHSSVSAWLWSPVCGEVIAVNRKVVEDPSVLATDPYGEGWLLRLKPFNLEEDLRVISRISFL